MLIARPRMSRRYTYRPRWTARDLSNAMYRLDLTIGQLARISGAGMPRIEKWLKGDDDVPPYIQRDLTIWQQHPEAMAAAFTWAEEHAHDVRSDDEKAPGNGR